ncbi:hypothetical protein M3Y96_01184500 [Aphelenchoides besseyi]|nr:hypothetical protein M3Y96_01184500 [Aphelenchoides besseyi]
MSSGFPLNCAISTIAISGSIYSSSSYLLITKVGSHHVRVSGVEFCFLNVWNTFDKHNFSHDLNSIMGFGGRECVWLIFCFLMPPLAIFLNSNECNVHVAVNVVVLFFFWLPGSRKSRK